MLCLTVLEILCLQLFDRQISQCRHAYAAGAASGVSEALVFSPFQVIKVLQMFTLTLYVIIIVCVCVSSNV